MEKVEKCRKNLFDIFSLSISPEFRYNFDGPIGRRLLFAENRAQTLTIHFEEGMSCLDLNRNEGRAGVEAEYKTENKYIHQLRIDDLSGFAFFHFEFTDKEGNKVILPGQLCAKKGYNWYKNEVEPVLVSFLNSIDLVEENDEASGLAY